MSSTTTEADLLQTRRRAKSSSRSFCAPWVSAGRRSQERCACRRNHFPQLSASGRAVRTRIAACGC